MARTNACARQGFEVAIERAQMFADADADADRAAWAKARLGAAAGRRGAMPLRLGGGRHEPSWPIENARRRRADPAQFALPIEKSGLAPARVEEMADLTAEEPLKEGESANTVAAYRAAMRYWAAWFAERFGMQIALPVSPAAVRTFITDHAQGKAGNGLIPTCVQ